jgi:hypothetical protein
MHEEDMSANWTDSRPICRQAHRPGGRAPYVEQGSWIVTADGSVFNFGDATFQGSLGAKGRADIVHIGAKP